MEASEKNMVVAGTTSVTPSPIYAALNAASKLLNPHGPRLEWRECNDEQCELLHLYSKQGPLATALDGMDAMAAYNVDTINAWLREKGFTIQLDPIQHEPYEKPFVAAGILDLTVEWYTPGTKQEVSYQGSTYPAFKTEGVGFYNSPGHANPVVALPTRSEHTIYATILDEHPGDGLDLYRTVSKLRSGMRMTVDHNYSGAVIPMITLSQNNDISWMVDMEATCDNGDRAWIVQALQQTKLRMNHLGARAQSAAAISGLRMMSFNLTQPYVIDQPFLTWWEQKDIGLFFAAYVMPTEWKDPGNDLSVAF
jgi:hypothetical protein